MIFWLEIDGKLAECEVYEPFSEELHFLNQIKRGLRRDEERDAVTQRIRLLARRCVEAEKYRIKQ